MARSAAGKLFQTRGPATANDPSPSRVLRRSSVQYKHRDSRADRHAVYTRCRDEKRDSGRQSRHTDAMHQQVHVKQINCMLHIQLTAICARLEKNLKFLQKNCTF